MNQSKIARKTVAHGEEARETDNLLEIDIPNTIEDIIVHGRGHVHHDDVGNEIEVEMTAVALP